MAAASKAIRGQISFYGSTPAYRPVLEHHGWGDLQSELNAMSKRGEWEAMADLIDDDILATFAVVAEPDNVADELKLRFGQTVDRLSFNTMGATDAELFAPIIAALKA